MGGYDGGVEAGREIGEDGGFGIVGGRNVRRFDLGVLIGLPVVVARGHPAVAVVELEGRIRKRVADLGVPAFV